MREQEVVADCQYVLRVLKFKKYKEGYEDRMRRASLRYSFDIGSFLMGDGQDPPEISAAHASEVETHLNASSIDIAPLAPSSLSTALDAGQVVGASSILVGKSSPNISSSDTVPPVTILPPVVPDTRQVSRAASEEATLPASTSEASYKGKGKVSD